MLARGLDNTIKLEKYSALRSVMDKLYSITIEIVNETDSTSNKLGAFKK